jgi:hypothetical protein
MRVEARCGERAATGRWIAAVAEVERPCASGKQAATNQ